MKAVTVSSRKLKITLSAKESMQLFEGGGKFSCLDQKTKRSLAALLRQALRGTDFTLDCERLLVEVYPSAFGGHIIYFTKPTGFKRFHKNPDADLCFLLCFKSSSDAADFCKKALSFNLDGSESRLYKYNGKYFILLRQNEKTIPFSIITEFTDSLLCSNMTAAIVGEHGKCIIKNDAIEVMSKI